MAWTGVAFRSIAERARVGGQGRSSSSWSASRGSRPPCPLEALLDDDVLVAHRANGAPLPPEHGGPVRMLVPRRYFYKSAKWLRGLKFVEVDEPGFWEVRGYSNVADPWMETRYDVDDVRVIHRMRKANLFRPVAGERHGPGSATARRSETPASQNRPF